MDEGGEVSETNQSKDFSFVISADPGEDVILPVHLSPETSAVSKNIIWYRGTELIYQYKNGLESPNSDYEHRLSLSIQELERGNLSLTLRNVQESDSGDYVCHVYHDDECQERVTVHLQVRGERQLQRDIMEQQRQIEKLKLEGQIKELEQEKEVMKLEKQIEKLKLEGQIRKLELEKQIMKLEQEKQIKEREQEQEKQIMKLEQEKQIKEKELERRIKELERQIEELPLHGPTPRRRNSLDGIPPRMSDDGTPETPETKEERATRDTMERESGDQNTRQTSEENTVTDQETPGTSS